MRSRQDLLAGRLDLSVADPIQQWIVIESLPRREPGETASARRRHHIRGSVRYCPLGPKSWPDRRADVERGHSAGNVGKDQAPMKSISFRSLSPIARENTSQSATIV